MYINIPGRMDALWDIQTETNLKVAIALWKAKDLDAV